MSVVAAHPACTPGDWRAVVMNADGSRGVTAELEFGARTSLPWWVGAALLGAGVLAGRLSPSAFISGAVHPEQRINER
jgi:DNA-binding transcriptional ArsR family regulator